MKDIRIDNYISKAEEFAKPILDHLRSLVHEVVSGVDEDIKWGFPHFLYNGNILCSMAAFKKHCAFTFWNGKYLKDVHKILEIENKTSMGDLGKITSLADLPGDKILKRYIKEASVIDKPKKVAPVKKTDIEKKLIIPDILMDELNNNVKAKETFSNFSYSNKKDYVEWITEAKTYATQQKRLLTAVQWLSEGKDRNWKYRKITKTKKL